MVSTWAGKQAPGKEGGSLWGSPKSDNKNWSWWLTPVILVHREAEVGGPMSKVDLGKSMSFLLINKLKVKKQN
jgi:hypothetical protein